MKVGSRSPPKGPRFFLHQITENDPAPPITLSLAHAVRSASAVGPNLAAINPIAADAEPTALGRRLQAVPGAGSLVAATLTA